MATKIDPADILLDRAIRHAILVERLKIGEVQRLIGQLNAGPFDDIEGVVLAAVSRIRSRGARVFDSAIWRNSLGRIRDISGKGFRDFHRAAARSLDDIIRSEATWQTRVLAQTVEGVRIMSPDAGTLRAIRTARPFQGRHLREWAAKLDADTFARVRGELRTGMLAGEDIDALMRRIRGTAGRGFTDGILQVSRHEAAMVVRTAITHVAARAHEAALANNPEVVRGVRWQSVLDSRTSVICAGLHGRTFALGSGPRPPAHPNACAAGTLVTTEHGPMPIELVEVGDLVLTHRGRWRRATAVMAAPALMDWQTPLELETASGGILRVTDEHPILTASGWRQAGEIQVGDDVFENLDQFAQTPRGTLPLATPVAQAVLVDAGDCPAGGDEPEIPFSVLVHSRGVSAAVELQRQGHAWERDVDAGESFLMNKLRDEVHSGIPEDSAEPLLMPGQRVQIRGATGDQDLPQNSRLMDGVGRQHLRSPHECRTPSGNLAERQPLRGGTSEPHPRERMGQGRIRDEKPPRHLLDRLPGLAVFGEGSPVDFRVTFHGRPHATGVVAIRRDCWRGAIYNLSVADDESYVADGVVVHNCRSIVTPWLHGEGRAPEQTYRDWFLSQPRAIQEATTFGPTRRRLLREGIPPERMVTRELRPLSVRELEALELRLEGG